MQRCCAAFVIAILSAATAHAEIRSTIYASGFSSPVAFVQDPTDSAVQFVVEQAGRIRVVRNGTTLPADFLDLRSVVSSGGERGLLGLAFAPDYASSHRFFVNFTNTSGNTVVARFKRSDNPVIADPASRFDLRWGPTGLFYIAQPYANHNGGNLVFGPDGFLYVGLGDGGSANDPENRAQNPFELLGKMLRLDVGVLDADPSGYRIPSDNPFASGAGPVTALGEIWSFGLRNPWRYSFDDPARGGTGALVIADVGQNAWEEIDYEPFHRGGRNYGWRYREGAHNNVTSIPPAYLPLTEPIHEYDHSTGSSITGGYVYRGSALGSSYRGRYFFADYVLGRVWSTALAIDPATGEATASGRVDHTAALGGAQLGNISSFGVDGNGELYVVSYSTGRILKIIAPPRIDDFDGDSKMDITVFRRATGTWMTLTSSSGYATSSNVPFGQAGDVPVSGDYDGDGKTDRAVFRPSNGTWYILRSGTGTGLVLPFGNATDNVVPGDYDGDGKTDPAVFRLGTWYVLTSSSGFSAGVVYNFGLGTDIPVPGDYDGDGKTDLAVFRRTTGTWYVATSSSGYTVVRTYAFGSPTDIPVPADYDGDGQTDLGVFRPLNGGWYISKSSTAYSGVTFTQFGGPSDVPVPGDYDGDGKADLAVYRQTAATWFVLRSTTGTTLTATGAGGNTTDIAIGNGLVLYALANSPNDARRAADIDADRKVDPALWRPSTGTWYGLESSTGYAGVGSLIFGASGDIPASGDYDADGIADAAVFRPSTGTWYILLSSTNYTSGLTVPWGITGDVPVPGDYDGDGKTDIGVFRPSTATWYILKSSTGYSAATAIVRIFGTSTDVPVVADYDGDGKADIAFYRPPTSTWSLLTSSSGFSLASGVYTIIFGGGPGDTAAPADIDGDGRADFVVFRAATGTWYVLPSSTGYTVANYTVWGQSGDIPVIGDYDADGKADFAIFRPSTGVWYILTSTSGYVPGSALVFGFGANGDIPLLRRP